MFQDAIVRSEIFIINSSEHPPLCLCSQNPMMRKTNISEIINSASVRFEDYFLWMHIEVQSLTQKDFYFSETIDQQLSAGMDKNKIISISDIADYFQFMFNELIQLVQIYVRKQLRSQIAQGQAGRKALDYISKKCHKPLVGCSFLKNI